MYILYDIGGTNMRLAVSKDLQTFSDAIKFSTPTDFDEAVDAFCTAALKLAGGKKIQAVAGGMPGPFDLKKTVTYGPNLPEWKGKPFQKAIQTKLGAPFFIENDTDIIGLGEAVYGAGKGKRIVVYVTVSTGVGGARIVDQKMDAAVWGQEPGHQIVDPGKTLHPSGELEDYISGTAVEKRFGTKPQNIDDPALWDELAKWLAYGLHNMVVHWSPEIMIVGGSMITKQPGISLDVVRSYLEDFLKIFPEAPELVLPGLPDGGGFYGAMQYLRVKLEEGEIESMSEKL